MSGAYWLVLHLFQDPVVHRERVFVHRVRDAGVQYIKDQTVRVLQLMGLELEGAVLVDHDAGISAPGPVPHVIDDAQVFRGFRCGDHGLGRFPELRFFLLFLSVLAVLPGLRGCPYAEA